MRRLETMCGDVRRMYYLPDDTGVNIDAGNGCAFYSPSLGEVGRTILWLTTDWTWVWVDDLEKNG